jgi:lipooligosaccharide transport system ATP-binding protein
VRAGAVILEASGLHKSYEGRAVVQDLELVCRSGTVLGLLGPNGAGKTTTLRMLYGFVRPDAGTITVDGKDFATHRTESKRLIGVCTQEDSLDYDFSVRQNLEVYATYFRPRPADPARIADELLRRFGMEEYADYQPRALSGGYKRRLQIARSLVHSPRILFLDEPTTGLDPRARIDVWELVAKLRGDGLAILLTTHYMDEAERLSDELCVLSQGRAVARGTPRDVLGRLVGEHVLVVPDDSHQVEVRAFVERELKKRTRVILGELAVALSGAELARVTERFEGARLSVRPPNLDDLFLELSVDEPAGAEQDELERDEGSG